MSWIEDATKMLSKFNISFSWDLPNDMDSSAIMEELLHVVDESDKRLQDQLVVGCVQATDGGVLLSHPRPSKQALPCEIHITPYPFNQEFCVSKVVVVSEARNLELYVEDSYEYTAKGIMLTIKKGRKASLYETEFDMSKFVNAGNKCSLKLLSFPNKDQVKIQAIILKVAPCTVQTPKPSSSIDMMSVQKFLESVGRPLSVDAQKMLNSLNQFHKSQSTNQLPVHSAMTPQERRMRSYSSGSLLSAAMSRARQQEEDERRERLEVRPATPEDDRSFINMLASLVADQSAPVDSNGPSTPQMNGCHDSDTESVQRGHPAASQRWETFLNSRLRASQRMARGSRPQSLVSGTTSRPSSRPVSVCNPEDIKNLQRLLTGGFQSINSPARSSPEETNGQSRCPECGCPGCLSVYNSFSTNIYAMEERIMSRLELRMEQLLQHIDNKFNLLAEDLCGRQGNWGDHRHHTQNHMNSPLNCDGCQHMHNTNYNNHQCTPLAQNNCNPCNDHQPLHQRCISGGPYPPIINTSV